MLQGVVDASYKYLVIDVGAYGKQSDGGVFRYSRLYTGLQNGVMELPAPKKLPGTNIKVPYVFVGDEAFPLLPYLMCRTKEKASVMRKQFLITGSQELAESLNVLLALLQVSGESCINR